jgi:hypothetical protein
MNVMSSSPSQNDGIAASSKLPTRPTTSSFEPAFRPNRTPSPTPSSAVVAKAVRPSRMVGSRRSPMISETARWFRNERPRSPCVMPPSHRT